MSHFTVLVIGEDPDLQLALYDENKEVDGQKQVLSEDEVNNMAEHYGIDPTDLAALAEKMGAWNGTDGHVENGELFYYSTYNPDSKWDWYQLGGRWTGFFTLKAGANGGRGSPGLLTANAEEGTADCAFKGDIDFDGMREAAAGCALARWDRAHRLMGDTFKTYESWETIRNRHSEDIDKAREEYRSQPAVVAVKTDDQFGWHHDDVMCSREECERIARLNACMTFAVVKDGEWYERGEMGWFGATSNEKEDDAWAEEYAKLLDGLPDGTMLSVYDCHI